MVFVDLDRFKDVSDTSGHRAGDAVLVAVAQGIVEAVRPFDVAGRLGGDEFGVLCPALATEDEATALAGRICAAVAASVRTSFAGLQAAITGAEKAVRREWGKAGSPDPGGEEATMRLVRTSRLLRSAERALEPGVLG